jgi:hypothetical protein
MSTTESNKLLQTITDSIPERISSSFSEGVQTDDSSSNWVIALIVIVLLAFLGINIFLYLAQGTQWFADFFGPLIAWFAQTFGYATLVTTEQTVKTSAEGTKQAVDIASGAVLTGVDTVGAVSGINKNARQYAQFNQMDGINSGKRVGQHVSSLEEEEDPLFEHNSLTKALQHASQNMGANDSSNYTADDSSSSVQVRSKTGWCYIGKEKGTRNCIEVGENDQCMSGDIFPTHQVCVNPNLRP